MVNGETVDFHLSLHTHFLPLSQRHFNACGALKRLVAKEQNPMGVIGRLDDQVNELIIKPVGARHNPERAEGQVPSEVDRPGETQPSAKEEARPDDEQSGTRPPELPVWLL